MGRKKKPEPQYSFRPGSRVTGVDAATAGEELARLRAEGPLTAPAVVEAAEPEGAPLHPAFEWDDATAAHEYRLNQARGLIRAVCVTYDTGAEPQPVYVHVTTEDAPRYEPVAVVAKAPELFASAMSELQAKLAGAIAAVKALEDAAKCENREVDLLPVRTSLEEAAAGLAAVA